MYDALMLFFYCVSLQVYGEVQYDTPARGGDRCKLVVGVVSGEMVDFLSTVTWC